MEISERCMRHLNNGIGFLIAVIPAYLLLIWEIETILFHESVEESSLSWFILAISFTVQAVLGYVFSAYAINFCIACIAHLLDAKKRPSSERFSLNILSYRLFYAPASRINVLVFGFFIGLYLQGLYVSRTSEHASSWQTLAWFFGGMIQGIIIQFFLQCLMITLHYTATYFFVRNVRKSIQMNKIKRQLLLIKKQAVHPVNLVASFVGMPLLSLLSYLIAQLLELTVSFQDLFWQTCLMTLFLYTEITLFLYILDVRQAKQKTKT